MPSLRLVSTAIILNLLSSTYVGYHSAYLNLPSQEFRRFFMISYVHHYGSEPTSVTLDILWTATISSALVAGIPTRFLSSYLLDRFGRRMVCIYVHGALVLISSVLMASSRVMLSFEAFMVGRLIGGMAAAVTCTGVPVYLSECCEPKNRGLIGCIFPIFIGIGLVLGVAVGHQSILGNTDYWPYIFLIWTIPTLVLMIFGIFVDESPKYLYITKRNEFDAKRSLKRYMSVPRTDVKTDTNSCTDALLTQFRKEALLGESSKSYSELALVSKDQPVLAKSISDIDDSQNKDEAELIHKSISVKLQHGPGHFVYPSQIKQVDPHPLTPVRKGQMLAICGAIASASCGLVLKDFYSADMLRDVGVKEYEPLFWSLMGSQLISLLGSVIIMALIERLGRRTLLLIGLIVSGISLLGFFAISTYQRYAYSEHGSQPSWISWVLIGWFIILSLINSLPPSVVSILAVELVPQSYRAKTAALASVTECGYATMALVGYSLFLPHIGQFGLLILFLMPLILSTIYIYVRLPETKGLSVNEIVEQLM